MPKITVIMPALNVAKFIKPCIESVCCQTLEDIEILFIDAGSTDGTWEIVEKYAEHDCRIRMIHSDKKSYGYQLNIGIAQAKGKYVGIVETDDEIVQDMLEELYAVAIEKDADYVKGKAVQFIDLLNGERWRNTVGIPLKNADMLGKIVEPCNMPELLVRDIYLWTGIYKRDYIGKVLLNETPGAAFQDQGFLFQTISTAHKAVYLDKEVYLYRQDNSNSSIFNKNAFHYLVGEYSYIEKFLENKNDKWQSIYYQRMFDQCLGRFRTMAASGDFWIEADIDMEILRNRLKYAAENKIISSKDMDASKGELLEIFLKGIKDIYNYYLSVFKKKSELLFELKTVVDKQQIVIFGSGRLGRFCHALLDRKSQGLVMAYCDNNIKLWTTKIQGITVISPKDAVKHFPDAMYVIANSRDTEEMRRQLQDYGIQEKNICNYHIGLELLLFHMDINSMC